MSDSSRLHSPWRSIHIDSFLSSHGHAPSNESGSVFTRIAASNDDVGNLVVWRGETVFVVMNLYPYNNGHLMVVPYRQVARYGALTDAERTELASTVNLAIKWLDEALEPEGYNVGMNEGVAGGAGVPSHIHVHVVPRWSGDTNFMPTVAETKVVPQAIEESYRRIQEIALRPER